MFVGEFDNTTPISDARFMHERLPHAAPLVVIPGAGHVSPLENPVAFNQALAAFLGTTENR